MVGTFGFFTISLPVTLAALAKNEFHSGPSGVGMLNAAMAVGALAGAITTARRTRPIRLRTIALAAWPLAAAQVVAALAASQALLAVVLVLVGAANLAFLTRAQSLVQLTVPDHLRGRVVGLYMLVFIGSGALGGPVVGLVDEHLGARIGLLVSGALPALVTALVARHLARRADVRIGLRRVTVQMVRPTLVTRR
jgi:MFS family permease